MAMDISGESSMASSLHKDTKQYLDQFTTTIESYYSNYYIMLSQECHNVHIIMALSSMFICSHVSPGTLVRLTVMFWQ